MSKADALAAIEASQGAPETIVPVAREGGDDDAAETASVAETAATEETTKEPAKEPAKESKAAAFLEKLEKEKQARAAARVQQQKDEEVAKLRAELEELRKFRSDPLKWSNNPKEVIDKAYEKLILEDDPNFKLSKELETLKKSLAERDEREKAERSAREEREKAMNFDRTMSTFYKGLEDNHPEIADEYDRPEIEQECRFFSQQVLAAGYDPNLVPDSELIDYLKGRAKMKSERRAQRAAQRQVKPGETSQTATVSQSKKSISANLAPSTTGNRELTRAERKALAAKRLLAEE